MPDDTHSTSNPPGVAGSRVPGRAAAAGLRHPLVELLARYRRDGMEPRQAMQAMLQRVTGADELVVTSVTHDHDDRLRSHELIAKRWGLPG